MLSLAMRFFSIVLIVIATLSCSSGNDSKLAIAAQPVYFTVTRVVDGDTFWIDNGSTGGEKIRLIGIDAPESRKTGTKEIGYFGAEAKAYLKTMLEGQKVRLEFDVDRKDKYKRTLAYAYLRNGVFINENMIAEGYAFVLTIPPNVKFSDHFIAKQKKARSQKKGLWLRHDSF